MIRMLNEAKHWGGKWPKESVGWKRRSSFHFEAYDYKMQLLYQLSIVVVFNNISSINCACSREGPKSVDMIVVVAVTSSDSLLSNRQVTINPIFHAANSAVRGRCLIEVEYCGCHPNYHNHLITMTISHLWPQLSSSPAVDPGEGGRPQIEDRGQDCCRGGIYPRAAIWRNVHDILTNWVMVVITTEPKLGHIC